MFVSSCDTTTLTMIMAICQRCKPSSGSDKNTEKVSWRITSARIISVAVRCACDRLRCATIAGLARSSRTRC